MLQYVTKFSGVSITAIQRACGESVCKKIIYAFLKLIFSVVREWLNSQHIFWLEIVIVLRWDVFL